MSACAKTIRLCIQEGLNLLLTGYHGVGKTQIVLEEAHRQGLVVKHYSSPTLDPWAGRSSEPYCFRQHELLNLCTLILNSSEIVQTLLLLLDIF